MSTHHCEECGAVLDPVKILRCTKCKAIFYCSKTCQAKNWKLHRRVCSADPALRQFIPTEMAVERALTKQLKVKAPTDATCYICLEGDGESSKRKLIRGCACRGNSAGFVHVECLTQLAMSKKDPGTCSEWTECGNCKQELVGALGLDMARLSWRVHRSAQHQGVRYMSTRYLGSCLGFQGELDVANKLLNEASHCIGFNTELLLDLQHCRADILSNNGQKIEALGLLQATLPAAKEDTMNPHGYCRAMGNIAQLLLELNRNEEAHEMATEFLAFTKAKFGLEHPTTLTSMRTYAAACATVGRAKEAKETFEHLLTTETRIVGRDHPDTQCTREWMRRVGIPVPPP